MNPLVRTYLALTGGLIVAIAACLWDARRQAAEHVAQTLPERRALVRKLNLTDLAIWTEARYTRHPSQADLFTPFQEFPGALEHFPAGSLLAPPSFGQTSRIEVRRRSDP